MFVLAVENERSAGYLKLNYAPAQTECQDAASLEIERIYVRRSHLGKGVGAELMRYAVERARRDNLEYVWLGVREHNPRALRFYEKHGFYRFGEHGFLLGDDPQLDYLLRKDL